MCAPSRAPDLVAAQHPPAAVGDRGGIGRRRTGRRRGRWPAPGRRPPPRRAPARRRWRPAPRGWGRRPWGSRGPAPPGSGPRPGRRTRRRRRRAARPRCPTPCSEVWTIVSVARAVRVDHRRGRVEVVVEHLARPASPSRRRRAGRRRPRSTRSICGGDVGVGRRHDLAAVTEVDLVAVVLRRVVAGRHHDAGVGAQVPDGEGEHRRGQRAGEQQRVPPAADHDGGRVTREHVGVVPGVVADDHAAARVRRAPAGTP